MFNLPEILSFGFFGIIVFACILVTLFVAIIWTIIKRFRKFSSIPTYDQYIQANPDSKTKDGTVCSKCRSSQIRARKTGQTPGSALFAHVCENCGTTLFRSKG